MNSNPRAVPRPRTQPVDPTVRGVWSIAMLFAMSLAICSDADAQDSEVDRFAGAWEVEYTDSKLGPVRGTAFVSADLTVRYGGFVGDGQPWHFGRAGTGVLRGGSLVFTSGMIHVSMTPSADGRVMEGQWSLAAAYQDRAGPLVQEHWVGGRERWTRLVPRLTAPVSVRHYGAAGGGLDRVTCEADWSGGYPVTVIVRLRGEGVPFALPPGIPSGSWHLVCGVGFADAHLDVSNLDPSAKWEEGIIEFGATVAKGFEPGRKVLFLNGVPFEFDVAIAGMPAPEEPPVFHLQIRPEPAELPKLVLGGRARVIAQLTGRAASDSLRADLSLEGDVPIARGSLSLYRSRHGAATYLSDALDLRPAGPEPRTSEILGRVLDVMEGECLVARIGARHAIAYVGAEPEQTPRIRFQVADAPCAEGAPGVILGVEMVAEVVYTRPPSRWAHRIDLGAGAPGIQMMATQDPTDPRRFRTGRFVVAAPDEGLPGKPAVPSDPERGPRPPKEEGR